MASNTLAREVLYRVSTQLLDAPDADNQFERWSERELVSWLNEGQKVIAKFLPASCSRMDSVLLATGTRQSIETISAGDVIPSDGSAPTTVRGKMLLDVIRNMGEDGMTPGRAMRLVKREALDAIAPDWHTESDTTLTEYAFDPRNPKFFWVYPGVSDAQSVWVEISYLANPKDVELDEGSMGLEGDSTAKLSIDDQFVDDLVNYMLARAHLKESETAANAQLVSGYTNLFLSSINAQAKAMTGVNPNLRVLPFAVDAPGAAS